MGLTSLLLSLDRWISHTYYLAVRFISNMPSEVISFLAILGLCTTTLTIAILICLVKTCFGYTASWLCCLANTPQPRSRTTSHRTSSRQRTASDSYQPCPQLTDSLASNQRVSTESFRPMTPGGGVLASPV